MATEAESPQQIGNYTITGELGRGGMGVVYEAEHTLTKRRTALKVLSPNLGGDDTHVQRFLREGKVAASLDDSGIVQVYEVGEDDGTLFMAMEFVDGMPLSQLLQHYGRLDPARATKVIMQAARALSVAHEAGIVHRDIKPANILIPRKGGLKIADFGLARALFGATTITETGAVMGTPYYMSPEQCRGETVNTRSDIYSLGVVYYELLTGSKPFNEETLHSLIYKIIEGDVPPVRERNPSVPPAMESVVRHMMASQPSDRYISMNEVTEDLRACLENRDTKAGAVQQRAALQVPDVLDESTIVLPRNRAPVSQTSRWPLLASAAVAVLLAVSGAIWAVAGGRSGPEPVAGVTVESVPAFTTQDELAELTEADRRAAQVANANLVVNDREPGSDLRVNVNDVFHPEGTIARYPTRWTEGEKTVDGYTLLKSRSRKTLDNGIEEVFADWVLANGRDTFTQFWLIKDNAAYVFATPDATHPVAVVAFPLYQGKSWEADLARPAEDGETGVRHVTYMINAERSYFVPGRGAEGEYRALQLSSDASRETSWLAPEYGLVTDSNWNDISNIYPGVVVDQPAIFGGFDHYPGR